MIAVFIPSQLHAYTGGESRLRAEGATVAEVLADLDRQYPGLRFRVIDEQDQVRRHMRIYVGQTPATSVSTPIGEGKELLIFGALSGG
ncbi:MAG TPA: MoaD/ThiS family protein [Caulobacteraceae bacterium]